MTVETLSKANEIKLKMDKLYALKSKLGENANEGAKLKNIGELWIHLKPYDDSFLEPVIGMLYEIIDARLKEELEELNNL